MDFEYLCKVEDVYAGLKDVVDPYGNIVYSEFVEHDSKSHRRCSSSLEPMFKRRIEGDDSSRATFLHTLKSNMEFRRGVDRVFPSAGSGYDRDPGGDTGCRHALSL